jgi:hypothetical protein
MTRSNSDSRTIVRAPTFVRHILPWLSHARTVHTLIPPSRCATSRIDSKVSIYTPKRNQVLQSYVWS